jgi:SAM-dependent methyltransferase
MSSVLKGIIRRVPVVGSTLAQIRRQPHETSVDYGERLKKLPVVGHFLFQLQPKEAETTADYWERRYRTGGSSGGGSYDHRAEFKAAFLNQFVAEHNVTSLIEHGCGDGAQLALARYPQYLGLDVSHKAVEMCRASFAGDPTKKFLHVDAVEQGTVADLSMSLDVIYHLVEDQVYEAYMRKLFAAGKRFVIVFSSNMDQEWHRRHLRHRLFTAWVEQNEPEWCLESTVKNPYPYDPENEDYTSFADFYVFSRR